LDEVSTSMTINAPASLLLLMYEIAAEEQGVDAAKSARHDPERRPQGVHRPRDLHLPAGAVAADHRRHLRLLRRAPAERFNTISISGYHMGEAGATPVQEIAFTLADGIAYVQAALDAGLDVDAFAPRLSFFFVARSTLLEEVAKFRAARRLWAGSCATASGPPTRSQMLRFHTQTAGVQLTAQQPEVNLVRVAIQALAATLGGTQSLHTNSFDEALALPTEKSARLALRTQQVIAHETDVPPASIRWRAATSSSRSPTDRGAEVQGYLDRIDRWAVRSAPSKRGTRSRRSSGRLRVGAKRIDVASRSWSASTGSSRTRTCSRTCSASTRRSASSRSTGSTRSSASRDQAAVDDASTDGAQAARGGTTTCWSRCAMRCASGHPAGGLRRAARRVRGLRPHDAF
jgi:methylmalonyl-CoA mutase, N-terminal domain